MTSPPASHDRPAPARAADKVSTILESWRRTLEGLPEFEAALTLGRRNIDFLTPWTEGEPLFFAGSRSLALAGDVGQAVAAFVQRQPDARLYYGYPVHMDEDSVVRPLFFTPVRIGQSQGGAYLSATDRPHLNHALLRSHGLTDDVIPALVRAVEKPQGFPSFREMLAFVCSCLGLWTTQFEPDRTERLPDGERLYQGALWANLPILYRLPAPRAHGRVRAALATLARPEAEPQIAESALAQLLGAPEPPLPAAPAPQPDRPPPGHALEIERIGASQRAALTPAGTRRLTAIEALPGTHKQAMLLNLVVSAVMNNERVLYLARRPRTVAGLCDAFDQQLARKARWAMRLSYDEDVEAAAIRPMVGTLRWASKLSGPPGAPENPDKKGPQERINFKELDQAIVSVYEQLEPARQALRRLAQCQEQRRQFAANLPPEIQDIAGRRFQIAATRADLEQTRKDLRNLLAGRARRKLVDYLNQAAAPLPAQARKAVLGGLEDDRRVAAALDHLIALSRVAEIAATETQLHKRMARDPGGRQMLNLLRFAQARKVSDCQKLFGQYWFDRLSSNPVPAERQVKAFYELLEHVRRASEASLSPAAARRLCKAVLVMAPTFPLWAADIDDASQLLPLEPGLFDLVIIDEADTLDPATLAPLVFRGRRAVVIGDDANRRLAVPPTLGGGGERQGDRTGDNGLTALGCALQAVGGESRRLVDHTGAHPLIGDLISRLFYQGALNVVSEYKQLTEGLNPQHGGLHWHHVPGKLEYRQGGLINEDEIKTLERVVQQWAQDGLYDAVPRRSIGVLAPLSAMAVRARQALGRMPALDPVRPRLIIGTAEAFRGQEIDLLVVLTMVGEGAPGWLQDLITRSRQFLLTGLGACRLGVHVIGDRTACRGAGGYLKALADHPGFHHTSPEAQASDEDDPNDPTFRDFDAVFADAALPTPEDQNEAEEDPLPALERVLDKLALPYIPLPGVGAQLITPMGGLYTVLLDSAEPPEDDTTLTVIVRRQELLSSPYSVQQFLEKLV